MVPGLPETSGVKELYMKNRSVLKDVLLVLKIMLALILYNMVTQRNRWAQFLCSHGSVERGNRQVVVKLRNKTECTLFVMYQARLTPDPNPITAEPGTIMR